jgi:hypothetical protein
MHMSTIIKNYSLLLDYFVSLINTMSKCQSLTDLFLWLMPFDLALRTVVSIEPNIRIYVLIL